MMLLQTPAKLRSGGTETPFSKAQLPPHQNCLKGKSVLLLRALGETTAPSCAPGASHLADTRGLATSKGPWPLWGLLDSPEN